MAVVVTSALAKARPIAGAPLRATQDPRWVRWLLTGIALVFLAFFLLLPLAAVFGEALRRGVGAYFAAVGDVDALASVKLTLIAALISVPANVLFGVAAAWCIAK